MCSKPLIANKVQRLAGEIIKLDRCDPPPFEHFAEILQRWDQISHRFDSIGLEIAAPSKGSSLGLAFKSSRGLRPHRRRPDLNQS
jgi:hypothetical protein